MAKNILHDFRIDELSPVDRPAQEPALKVLMKRNDSNENELTLAIKKVIAGEDIVQDIASRALELTKLADDNTAKGGLKTENNMSQTKKAADEAENTDDQDTGDSGENKESVESQEAQDLKENLDEANKSLDDINKKLTEANDVIAKSEALSTMNDVQKAHYNSLKDEEAKTYLAKSFDERQEELLEITKANKVVYKSLDGTEYHKNDDVRLIALAKRADEDHDALQKSLIEKKNLEYTKRAEDELSNLPGKVETHVALLKAVDGIEDDSQREEASKTLKAHNASMGSAFTTVGSSVVSKAKEGADPSGELDTLAKSYAEKHDMDFYKAYDVVSQKNPELVSQAVATN